MGDGTYVSLTPFHIGGDWVVKGLYIYRHIIVTGRNGPNARVLFSLLEQTPFVIAVTAAVAVPVVVVVVLVLVVVVVVIQE